MLRWAQDGIRELALDDIGEHYGRYRLHLPEAERAMARSLERYGQISPMVVCLRDGHYELIDGFKRLAAARTISGMSRVSIRVILVDERGAKAAIYGLNRAGGRTRELEEAWIVHALVREDRLTQVEVAELLGRHKSWVCRRLALIERLGSEAKDELRVGLLCPTAARQIVRLPEGNQAEVLQVIRREALSTVELSAMVDLLLECPGRRQQEFVLQNPREALAQKKGFVAVSSRDPRLSQTGNEVSKRLGFLIEMLAKMEVWLTTRGRTALTPGDQALLRPRFDSSQWRDGILRLVAEGLAGRTYRLRLRNAGLVISVEGASRDGEALVIQFPAGAPGEFLRKDIAITSAPPRND